MCRMDPLDKSLFFSCLSFVFIAMFTTSSPNNITIKTKCYYIEDVYYI